MAVAEAIDIRELLLESPEFGPAEIEQLEEAVAGVQCSEVRQQLHALNLEINSGDRSPRNLRASGVSAYLLANHPLAIETLSHLKGDGIGDYYQARALMAMGRFGDAADQYQKAAKSGYDSVQCALERAGAIRMSGRIDQAEEVLSANSREGVTRAEYSYQKGCICSDRGDVDGAIEYFERAADMDPYHSGALFRLAGLNDLLGNDDEAIKLYERSLSKPPLFHGALMNLGLLYEDREQYGAAAFCFRRILGMFPNDQRARLYLKDIEATGDMYYDEDAARRNRELQQVMRVPIADFELSARSRNCLEAAGIHTLGDLTEVSEQELLSGKNFGETSLKEIREILETRGLRIGQSIKADRIPMYLPEHLSPQERSKLDTPVTELDLSVRARKCLSRLGIVTIGELVSKSPDDLLSVRNFGVTSLNEIRGKLAEAGMSLRND